MIKKIWFALGILFTFYLLIPAPQLPPPDLINSVKSDLPGDTVQIENVAGYFTNVDRQQVIDYYQQYFSKSSFLGIPLLTIKLNHPPEYAKDVYVDTMQSYYLEELVHPFRENLFINGYTWQKDVFTPKNEREQYELVYKDQTWDTKVTLRWFNSSVIIRLGLFWLVWLLSWQIGKFWVTEIKEFKLKKYEL